MIIYSGTSKQFIQDTVQNQIAGKLAEAFFTKLRWRPQEAEVRSWHNSLRALKDVIVHGDLTDHGILLEYQLPLSSKRLDCMISGHDRASKPNAVVVELKQWDKVSASDGANEVVTRVGGSQKEKLHPSAQVGGYCDYLSRSHTAFYEGDNPIGLSGCSYLHNYRPVHDDPLLASKFDEVIGSFPLFTTDDVDTLSSYLQGKLGQGGGVELLHTIETSRYRPNPKLMQHVAGLIKGEPIYVLLDEQKVVYDTVFAILRKGLHRVQKSVVIVHGGPGSGKSVIALNLVADMLRENYSAHHATGSKAFTETLKHVIADDTFFKYFNQFMPHQVQPNEVDVIVCDEAHRIRENSNTRFTKAEFRSTVPQVDELMRAARVTVFFIDDKQVVRPGEIGSSTYIHEAAQRLGAKVHEFELEAQFRCNGSDAFINWVDNTLEVRRTANVIWNKNDPFEVKLFNSPQELEDAIIAKAATGASARMTAGFCWKWSDPNADGTLVNDVTIGSFQRPWNAKPRDQRRTNQRVRLEGVPESTLWAYDPQGVKQIGCIYTAQGFEFDYVGIIVGKDLLYRFDQNWVGDPSESQDFMVKRSREQFLDLVKNTYRVLFTRGMKGCYIHFMDKETENFVRSRME